MSPDKPRPMTDSERLAAEAKQIVVDTLAHLSHMGADVNEVTLLEAVHDACANHEWVTSEDVESGEAEVTRYIRTWVNGSFEDFAFETTDDAFEASAAEYLDGRLGNEVDAGYEEITAAQFEEGP